MHPAALYCRVLPAQLGAAVDLSYAAYTRTSYPFVCEAYSLTLCPVLPLHFRSSPLPQHRERRGLQLRAGGALERAAGGAHQQTGGKAREQEGQRGRVLGATVQGRRPAGRPGQGQRQGVAGGRGGHAQKVRGVGDWHPGWQARGKGQEATCEQLVDCTCIS